MKPVWIIDDDRSIRWVLEKSLTREDIEFKSYASAEDAQRALSNEVPQVVVSDIRMPGSSGLDFLQTLHQRYPLIPVIIMTAFSAIENAVESIRQGAYHYLTKPFKAEELVLFLRRALDESQIRREAAALKRTLRERFAMERILGGSAAMRHVREIVARVASVPVPVLILGETGTGKSLVAQAIHAESQRASHPLVIVNCAALPETLLESELFGYVKGAFTGAATDRPGLFREADSGTLFLDEIGEMAPGLQAKLELVG